MKRCSKCNKNLDEEAFSLCRGNKDGRQDWCRLCQSEHNKTPKRRAAIDATTRRYRMTDRFRKLHNKDSALRVARNPQRAKARRMVGNAIHAGKLKRQPCSIRGVPEAQAHHKDYSKPFDIVWLCFKHHREAHGQKPTGSVSIRGAYAHR